MICKCYGLFSLDTMCPAQPDLPFFLYLTSLKGCSEAGIAFVLLFFVSINDHLVLISSFILAPYQGLQLKDLEVKNFVVLYTC